MTRLSVERSTSVDRRDLHFASRVARQLRRHIVRLASGPHGCHLGGSLSCVEILVALYYGVLRHDPANPDWTERDLFIFSKGHAAAALYAVLAERGYFSTEELATYAAPGSRLLGHPTKDIPGVEFATGSMGHGLSLGVGVALGLRRQNAAHRRVFVLVGDGELQEGSVWEAAMSAAHYRLGNLCAVVDRNFGQNDGETEAIMGLGDVAARWRAFGWAATTVDGHDVGMIQDALGQVALDGDRPSVLVAQTVKGRGVPGIEGDPRSHYMTLAPRTVQRTLQALRDPSRDDDGVRR